MTPTLRFLIAGEEKLAVPYLPEQDDYLAKEFWPRRHELEGLGRLAVFVQDGNVLHFIGGGR